DVAWTLRDDAGSHGGHCPRGRPRRHFAARAIARPCHRSTAGAGERRGGGSAPGRPPGAARRSPAPGRTVPHRGIGAAAQAAGRSVRRRGDERRTRRAAALHSTVDAIRDVTLSAVVLTRDEEAEIGECLRSLAFCDEIVVVDSGSTDRTVEIAHAAGCRILHHPLVDFAESRNLGLRAARGDWVLFVDADERVSAELQHEIRSRIAGGGAEPPAGFSLLRMEWLCG